MDHWWASLLIAGLTCAAVARGDDSVSSQGGPGGRDYGTTGERLATLDDLAPPSDPLNQADLAGMTQAQLKAVQAAGRRRKELQRKLRGVPLVTPRKGQRPTLDDHFVVAFFRVSAAEQSSEVRFAAIRGAALTADRITNYLAGAARNDARLFQVVSRFDAEEAAERAVDDSRRRYDDSKSYYQNELLKYVGLQQPSQVRSMRRC